MPADSAGSAVGAGQMVGGLTPFSTVDWPDQIVATVFLKGCPWRCVYCHNKDFLTAAPSSSDIAWTEVLAQIEGRKGLLDGVVFTGGEPTATAALPQMIEQVRSMGFAVGLHTNGVDPERVKALVTTKDASGAPFIDWVGLDIKAPFTRYEEITQRPGSGEAARETLAILQDAGIDHELRTTLYPSVFDEETLVSLAQELADMGETAWVLQRCREEDLVHEMALPFVLGDIVEERLKPIIPNIVIR